jgi:hypothetical protein
MAVRSLKPSSGEVVVVGAVEIPALWSGSSMSVLEIQCPQVRGIVQFIRTTPDKRIDW